MKAFNELLEMKQVDIKSVDKSTLTDISKININTDLPVEKRINSFLSKVTNPYCVLVGDIAVKFSYMDTQDTITDRMKLYFSVRQSEQC